MEEAFSLRSRSAGLEATLVVDSIVCEPAFGGGRIAPYPESEAMVHFYGHSSRGYSPRCAELEGRSGGLSDRLFGVETQPVENFGCVEPFAYLATVLGEGYVHAPGAGYFPNDRARCPVGRAEKSP